MSGLLSVAAIFLLVAGKPDMAGASETIFVAASEPAAVTTAGASSSRRRGLTAGDLPAALRVARKLRAERGRNEEIVILLEAGVHRIGSDVRLGPNDSGTPGAPLIIRGAGGAARLSGSVVLGPAKVREGVRATAKSVGMRQEFVAQVAWFAVPETLRSLSAVDVVRRLSAISDAVPFELFDERGPLRPASWPDEGYASASLAGTDLPGVAVAPGDVARAAGWAGSPEPWIGGYLRHEYAYEAEPIGGIDVGAGVIRLSGGSPGFTDETVRFRVLHAGSELDQPGEWVRSRDRRSVLVIERQGAGRLEASVARNLIAVDGARHVRFEGLVFERSRGGAVTVSNSRNVEFVDCVVRQTGGYGIAFLRTTDSGVRDSRFEDTGEEAVRLSGGDRALLVAGRNFVADSVIVRFSRLGRSYRPGVLVGGVGHSVVGNFISGSPHAGIILAGNDHLVEGNEISHVASECSDCGAIYMYRDWTARGTRIQRNFLHDIHGDEGTQATFEREVKGIYLDDFTSGTTVSENVLLRVDQGVFIGGGRDNVVERNLFIASEPAVHIDGRGLTWAADAVRNPSGQLRANLAAMPVGSAPWRSRYPGLADILSASPERPSGNRVSGNLFASRQVIRRLVEVRPGDVELSPADGGEQLGPDEISSLKEAGSAGELRALAARALLRLGLAGLPLEKMDRQRLLAKQPER
ncbi:MAG: right-handed parallel beta-helix repeat-containing protein [Alphaproteobacteria bacterium]|nr:right-handed parallel beta-helix repeat-containing protein [Alphaproteobacteria bacterium]